MVIEPHEAVVNEQARSGRGIAPDATGSFILLAGWIGFYLVAGAEEGRGGPRLIGFAHGATGLAVGPLVEFPLVIATELVQFGETHEFAAGDFMKP